VAPTPSLFLRAGADVPAARVPAVRVASDRSTTCVAVIVTASTCIPATVADVVASVAFAEPFHWRTLYLSALAS